MSRPQDRYSSDDYIEQNPSWDLEDSPWKAGLVGKMLRAHQFTPTSICDVGCGAGLVLAELRKMYPDAALYGFDVAPAASRFWSQYKSLGIEFKIGEPNKEGHGTYDALLILDVIEHVPDPFDFLIGLRNSAQVFVLHIPLDLSALSVMRERPLLKVRSSVGHIHYFTKGLALALLAECGFKVLHWEYSRAGLVAPRRGWKARLAALPRRLAFRLGRDVSVRALGGETLLVLASSEGPQ